MPHFTQHLYNRLVYWLPTYLSNCWKSDERRLREIIPGEEETTELFDSRSFSILCATGLLGAVSATPFFFTALSLGEKILPKSSSTAVKVSFNYVFAVSAEITNTLFAWNVLYSMANQPHIVDAIKSHVASFYKDQPYILSTIFFTLAAIIVETLLWLSGLGAIAPFTYELLIAGGQPLWYIGLVLVATFICTVVYYRGADICYKLRQHVLMQKLGLNLRLSLRHVGVATEVDYYRNLLLLCEVKAALQSLEATVRIGYEDSKTPEHRQLLEEALFQDSDQVTDQALLRVFFSPPEGFILFKPQETHPVRYALFRMIWFVLACLGLMQNEASVYYAYIIATVFGPYAAAGFATLEGMNGLGFTIDGAFGNPLKRMIMELLFLRDPYLKKVSSWYHLRWPVLLCGAFSGGSNQSLHYDATIAQGGRSLDANIVSLLVNIGTALSFNLPQCIAITEEIIFFIMSSYCPNAKQGILLEQRLLKFAQSLEYASLRDIQMLCCVGEQNSFGVDEEASVENPLLEHANLVDSVSPSIEDDWLRFFTDNSISIDKEKFAAIKNCRIK